MKADIRPGTLVFLRAAAIVIVFPFVSYAVSEGSFGVAAFSLVAGLIGIALVEWLARRPGWKQTGDPYAIVVGRVCAFFLAMYAVSAGWFDVGLWLSAIGVVLGLTADGVLAHASGARGRELVIEVLQTGAVMGLFTALLYLPDQIAMEAMVKYSLGPVVQMAAIVLALVGVALVRRSQGAILWIISGAFLFGALSSSVPIGPSSEATVLSGMVKNLLIVLLAYGTTGAFALYLRRVADPKTRSTKAVARLAMAGGVIVFTLVFAGTIVWYMVSTLGSNMAWGDFRLASAVSTELASEFGTATATYAPTPDASLVATPASGPAARLISLARGAASGLTIVDTRTRSVLIAVRMVSLHPGDENSASEMRAVRLSTAESAAIRSAMDENQSYGELGSAQPVAAWAFLGQGETPAPALAVVVTREIPDWQNEPVTTPFEDTMGLFEQFFPYLFVVLLIPSSIALLILERRDRVTAELLFAQERARLSRDAHDRVYNRMTALANRLEGADPGSGATSAGEVRGALGDLQRILGDVDVRASAGVDAGSELFDDLVADQADRWGLKVTLEGADALAGLDPRLSWELQCVVEEALTNAGRHGHASNATVRAVREARALRVTVTDDGSGVVPPIGADGLPENASGLRGMLDRVHTLGGTLKLASSAEGTSVDVEVPL